MVSYKAPSYGLFKTNVTPLYWFGIPRNVKMDGLVMDVDHITHLLAHKNNDTQQWINYNRASGARLSAMEHLVPEQMFSTEDSPANGISAVKALQLAAAEGQKIWTITRTNLDIALNGLQLPTSVETDIRNSVYAGKEVTAHEKPVSFFGKSSIGYTVLDPETGAGAYLIGGGENGGRLLSDLSAGIGHLAILTSVSSFFWPLIVTPPFALAIAIFSGIIALASLSVNCSTNPRAIVPSLVLIAMIGAAIVFAYYAIIFATFASLAAMVSTAALVAFSLDIFAYILSTFLVC